MGDMMLQTADHRTADLSPASRDPVRPPGALSEAALAGSCTGCGDCVSVCPATLLSLDLDGCPVLSARDRCRHCGLCADVCMHGAIELTARTRAGLALVMALERDMLGPSGDRSFD